MTAIIIADSAIQRIEAFLRSAPTMELVDQITGAFGELGAAATALDEIADQLARRHPAIIACELALSGELDMGEFEAFMAAEILKAEGNDTPTEEQLAERLSELRTSSAFISSLKRPEN